MAYCNAVDGCEKLICRSGVPHPPRLLARPTSLSRSSITNHNTPGAWNFGRIASRDRAFVAFRTSTNVIRLPSPNPLPPTSSLRTTRNLYTMAICGTRAASALPSQPRNSTSYCLLNHECPLFPASSKSQDVSPFQTTRGSAKERGFSDSRLCHC